jgi:hypothetical protein
MKNVLIEALCHHGDGCSGTCERCTVAKAKTIAASAGRCSCGRPLARDYHQWCSTCFAARKANRPAASTIAAPAALPKPVTPATPKIGRPESDFIGEAERLATSRGIRIGEAMTALASERPELYQNYLAALEQAQQTAVELQQLQAENRYLKRAAGQTAAERIPVLVSRERHGLPYAGCKPN